MIPHATSVLHVSYWPTVTGAEGGAYPDQTVQSVPSATAPCPHRHSFQTRPNPSCSRGTLTRPDLDYYATYLPRRACSSPPSPSPSPPSGRNFIQASRPNTLPSPVPPDQPALTSAPSYHTLTASQPHDLPPPHCRGNEGEMRARPRLLPEAGPPGADFPHLPARFGRQIPVCLPQKRRADPAAATDAHPFLEVSVFFMTEPFFSFLYTHASTRMHPTFPWARRSGAATRPPAFRY